MSFAVFRKYQKPLLWAAVVFSVLIFATFSGFGDLKALLTQQDMASVAGEFDVLGSGQRKQVSLTDFAQVRQSLNRFAYAQRQRGDIEDAEVWAFLIRQAEAEAAGLDVAESEVSFFCTGGRPMTRDEYRSIWRDALQFASARDMEAFARELLRGNRWVEMQVTAAGVVNADDVYLRWRGDNERFDYEALVFPDVATEDLPEPGAEDLQKLWDETPESVRGSTYSEPRRVDVAYAWAPLAAGEPGPLDETLAAEPEPPAADVEQRFAIVKGTRWPDATEPSDGMRAAVTRELKLIALTQKAVDAFEAGADQSVQAFRTALEGAGLKVEDPEGLLGSEEVAALPDIGNDILPLYLAQQPVGTVHLGMPYGDQDDVHAVLVQAEEPSRPLTFEEAHDKLVKAWQDARRDQPAKDFREALRQAARERPECAAIIGPLLTAAEARADAEAAALGDATDEARAARRQEVLDEAERVDIAPRVAEFEHLAWDDVPRPEGARLLTFSAVPRSYARHPTGDEEPTSVERQLKTTSQVFRLGVDAVSEPIRHAPSSQTSIVRIRARSFPDQAEMQADAAGLETARKALSSQREREAQFELSAQALIASHNLMVAEPRERTPVQLPEVPPDA